VNCPQRGEGEKKTFLWGVWIKNDSGEPSEAVGGEGFRPAKKKKRQRRRKGDNVGSGSAFGHRPKRKEQSVDT